MLHSLKEQFLPILLASLIFDIATSFVQVTTLLMIAACRTTSSRADEVRRLSVKFLKFTARLLTLIGVGLTITLIGFVIFYPIRYNVDYSLVESTKKRPHTCYSAEWIGIIGLSNRKAVH